MLSKAKTFLAGAAWNDLRCCACCPLAAGRHRWAALVARGVVGFWLRLMARGSFARRTGVGGVLSLSRERTKGRPVAANPRQHHGCPRTPRRLVWGRNLLLREAICFLAGAAWNSLGCYAARPLAAGRHRWAALVGRGVVGLSRTGGTGCSHNFRDGHDAGFLSPCMPGGAGVISVGLRRRSPPLAPKAERTTPREAGRP